MSKELTIVLVSGGMDSCVVTSVADTEYELAILHVNYGQLTEKRELKAFNDIADYYKVSDNRRLVVDISYLAEIGGSSLTDKRIEIDSRHSDNNPTNNNGLVPNTYVPFRNTHFLAIAVSWAEVISARSIFIGAVAQDRPGYPDCNQVYFNAFNKLITVGTKPSTQIKILTPIIGMQKSEIVKKGFSLNAPLDLTWSCYKNSEVACGKCNSCALRLEAFRKAEIDDPVRYA